MKGSCKIPVELEYLLKKSTRKQLINWTGTTLKIMGTSNGMKSWSIIECGVKCRESARDVYSKRIIIVVTKIEMVEWNNYKHLDWITIRRDDDKLYKFKEGNFNRLHIQDIKDMLLLLVQGQRMEIFQLGVESYQKKLNLTKPDTYKQDLKRRDAYTSYSNPRGFIYQNKNKKNRLMHIDELHKFSDGSLDDVWTALNDRLKGIRMQYLPQTIWKQCDKDNARAMIQSSDKLLKTRRIMRSLEKFVGGRPYEGEYEGGHIVAAGVRSEKSEGLGRVDAGRKISGCVSLTCICCRAGGVLWCSIHFGAGCPHFVSHEHEVLISARTRSGQSLGGSDVYGNSAHNESRDNDLQQVSGT
ncbi:hypothetical protein Tco_0122887 [Tanacetum coccineum]